MSKHDHQYVSEPRQHRAFAISVVLNVGFVGVEVAFGLISGSMALLADAAHNLGDVLGLGLAWGATLLARVSPTDQRTYGWRKSTVLAALLNALLILVAVGGVAWEAIGRLQESRSIDGWLVMLVAGIGAGINGVSAALFFTARHRDTNMRGAFLHLAADAAVSVGVVVAGGVVVATGWYWVDPLTSLIIAVVIIAATWGLLRESVDQLMDAVPSHIDPHAVRTCLCGLDGITAVHDLHIWAMSTKETALTAHLEVSDLTRVDEMLRTIEARLEDDFGISHTTIQLEPGARASVCGQGQPGSV